MFKRFTFRVELEGMEDLQAKITRGETVSGVRRAKVPKGLGTIIIAHALFCVSFVAMTVKARVRGFDWTLEDAAMDLGARPSKIFFVITLPIIAPALISGWLLSFTISLDDLVIERLLQRRRDAAHDL